MTCSRGRSDFTENGIRLPLGNEGLWFRMSGRGTYRFYVPDVETQQIAYFGTVTEKERDATLQDAIVLRLKVVNGLITEAEQLVIRPEGGLTSNGAQTPRPPSTGDRVEKMGAPNPDFREVIPEARRASRDELIRTANYYFSGLQRNDGKATTRSRMIATGTRMAITRPTCRCATRSRVRPK